jgi:hypothetical protein
VEAGRGEEPLLEPVVGLDQHLHEVDRLEPGRRGIVQLAAGVVDQRRQRGDVLLARRRRDEGHRRPSRVGHDEHGAANRTALVEAGPDRAQVHAVGAGKLEEASGLLAADLGRAAHEPFESLQPPVRLDADHGPVVLREQPSADGLGDGHHMRL